MFRDNEASRVGAVLAAKLAGDTRGVVDAAVALWLSAPERPAESDPAVAEAWSAIAETAAVASAIEAGLALLRDRRPFRSSAFIDLVEHVDDPERLLAIATEVLDARWAVHPYVAAIFIRLVEAGHAEVLWRYIRRHRKRLASDRASWILVGYMLTTSWIGNRHDVDKWFRDWEDRAHVPMWIIAAYAATVGELPRNHLRQLVEIARTALAHATPDVTEGYFVLYQMIDDLRAARDADFLARMARYRGLVDRHTSCPVLQHPLVRYANRVKHRHPITLADWNDRNLRSLNRRILDLIAAIHRLFAKTADTLPVFAHLLSLPPGAPEAHDLRADVVYGGRLDEIPWLQTPWERVNGRG